MRTKAVCPDKNIRGEVRARPSVIQEMSLAVTESYEKVERAIARVNEQPELNTAIAGSEEFISALSRCLEIGRWLFPRPKRPKLTKKGRNLFIEHMVANGEPLDLALKCADAVRRGAPVKTRQMAIVAYELMLADPQLKWKQVAQKLCRCGSARHDFKCSERIRAQVGHLELFLKKHHITVS